MKIQIHTFLAEKDSPLLIIMTHKLLLLDINGVLCCKFNKDKNADLADQLSQVSLENNTNIVTLKSYSVLLRPGYQEFLNYCYENFTVGFFSSTTYPNANAILEKLLTPEQKTKTLFKWFRDRTSLDPSYGTDPKIKRFDTIKKLSDVFSCPTINESRKYSEKNTILCDDSEIKTRFNHPKNVVVFPEFTGDLRDTFLFDAIKLLPQRFEDLLR